MFPFEILSAYIIAATLVVLAPGPDNVMAMSRGISQGSLAAFCSALGNASGIVLHTLSATFGLLVLLQTSEYAFLVVKVVGALYLIGLGVLVLRSNSLITIEEKSNQGLPRIYSIGLLMNFFNPKPGLFIFAFLPQFVSPDRGAAHWQMLGYGFIFALITVIVFSVMGALAHRIRPWLQRGNSALYLNRAAGLVFIVSGVSILTLGKAL